MMQKTLRVEPIDNRHSAWSDVLAAIFRAGRRESLLLGEDGWLSARQSVLAAFDGPRLVGHLCFRVEPTRSSVGQTRVNSRMDSFFVNEEYADHPVDEMLLQQAEHQARVMSCPAPRLELAGC